MTRIIITALSIIISLISNAQEGNKEVTPEENGITIKVSIPKITNEKGTVYFALYNSEENFNKREAFQAAQGKVELSTTEVFFKNVPEGAYAISCYHDSNDNQKMDFDGYMPIEDYGSSNNPTLFGPPQFEISKFEVKNVDLEMEIRF